MPVTNGVGLHIRPGGTFRFDIADKKGHWLEENFPHGASKGEGFSRNHKVTHGNLMQMPIPKRESSDSRLIAEANIN